MSHRWYILQVYSGFEKKVAQAIEEQAAKKNLQDEFEEILVPSEEVMEVRRGNKVKTEKKLFPGYVVLKMNLTDQSWSLVKTLPKVTDFLGSAGKPSPISQAEAMRILNQVDEGVAPAKPTIKFEIGEEVRVSDGPFAFFNGLVEEIDEERERLKVSVMIFGRSTPVELEYTQLEKI